MISGLSETKGLYEYLLESLYNVYKDGPLSSSVRFGTLLPTENMYVGLLKFEKNKISVSESMKGCD